MSKSDLDSREDVQRRFLAAADKYPLYHLLIRDTVPSRLGTRCIPAEKGDALDEQLAHRPLPLPAQMIGWSEEEVEYWRRCVRNFGAWEFFHLDRCAGIGRFMLLADGIGEARHTFGQLVRQALPHIPTLREEAKQCGDDHAWLHALYRRGSLVSDTVAAEPVEWLPENVFSVSAAVLADNSTKTAEGDATANAPLAGQTGSAAPIDVLTTAELAALAGVGRDRFHNVLSEERRANAPDLPLAVVKGSGSRDDQFSYAQARPFLLRKWRLRAMYFPESFAEVKSIPSAHEQRG